MEQWEHMAVESRSSSTGRVILAYTHDGRTDTIDHEGNSMSRLLKALNELGHEGWQLVDTEVVTAPDAYRVTYYLKRPVPEAGGGWATGV
jgi:hypothetical protein